MSAIYTSGTFTSAAAVGVIRYSQPFSDRGDAASYILEQDFVQAATSFSPIASGTVHPSVSGFYLVVESPPEDIGGGMIRWTRTYAKKPATRNEPGTVSFQFPGWAGIWTASGEDFEGITGRDAQTLTVPAKIEFAYYRIASSGGDYTDWTSIPIVERQRFLDSSGSSLDTLYLRDSPPWAVATSPSLTTYQSAISGGTTYYAAQDSEVEQWMGPYYVRRTIYVKPR